MALTASIDLIIRAALTSPLDGSTPIDDLVSKFSIDFANGTGANQANMIWHDQRTLAASTTEDLDLAGGVTNAFGVVTTFTKIKAIIVKAAAANTNNVQVGGDTNGLVNWVASATDIVSVRPGGLFVIAAPDATAYGVTADTGDILQVANSSSGTSVTYDIIIIGIV